MAISMLKIRRPLGRLIFNMGIAIPGKTVFLIETAPRCRKPNIGSKLSHSSLMTDAVLQHRAASTLDQIMVCCLTVPNHYLNQYFYGIHLREFSQKVLMNIIQNMCSEITRLRFLSCFTRANGFREIWLLITPKSYISYELIPDSRSY